MSFYKDFERLYQGPSKSANRQIWRTLSKLANLRAGPVALSALLLGRHGAAAGETCFFRSSIKVFTNDFLFSRSRGVKPYWPPFFLYCVGKHPYCWRKSYSSVVSSGPHTHTHTNTHTHNHTHSNTQHTQSHTHIHTHPTPHTHKHTEEHRWHTESHGEQFKGRFVRSYLSSLGPGKAESIHWENPPPPNHRPPTYTGNGWEGQKVRAAKF